MPTTMDVATRLVELCEQEKNLQAIDELYSPDIVSREVHGDANMPATMKGIEAIRGKNKWWLENHEIHSSTLDGPWPFGDQFIITWKIEVTAKAGPMAGKRFKMSEAALYTLKDGKIAEEQFFYHMG